MCIIRHPCRFFVALVAIVLLSGPAFAGPFQVVQDDRSLFNSLLNLHPVSTAVDQGDAFATAPTVGTYTSLSRTGNIDGAVFSYDIHHVDFSNTASGTLTPGSVGGDIAALRSFRVEDPVAQDGASAPTWGLDETTGGTTTRNALLLDFAVTPGDAGIGHFGIDLLDVEGSFAFTPAELRLYDAGQLVHSDLLDFGVGAGDGESHFLGVVSSPGQGGVFFDQVMIVVGDDSAHGGNYEHWAAHGMTLGQASVSVAEPGSLMLILSSLLALPLFMIRWARRRILRPVSIF